MFSNVFTHWKTSVAGILIGLVAVFGVLQQNGVTGGKLGTGTVIGIGTAIATVILGLIARDPGGPPTPAEKGAAK